MNRHLAFVLAALVAAASALTVTAAGQSGPLVATGLAFLPNPVAALQDQSLTDQKDADYAALAPAYRRVTLTNLDGSGFLRGDWVTIVSETGNPAFSSRNSIGATQADTVILNAHFDMPDPTMPELAAKTVAVAKQIYGNGVANEVKQRSWRGGFSSGSAD